jgi:hypothetical protein
MRYSKQLTVLFVRKDKSGAGSEGRCLTSSPGAVTCANM